MKLKLTDVTIRNLPIPEKGQKSYYDLTFPTLAVRVSQGGTKTFVLETGKRGHRTLKTLGRYPALSLADARSMARVAQTSAIPDMPVVTFGEAVQSYIGLTIAHISRKHAYEVTRILTKTFEPLHAVPITSISSKHISDIIDALVPAVPGQALYVHNRIKTFMRWCRMRSLIQVNPIEFLPPPSRYIPRDRILTDGETCRVWHAASQMGTYGRIIQLLICTGCRRNEIASLRMEWIQHDVIVFPREATKSQREHILPITYSVSAIIHQTELDQSTQSLLFLSGTGNSCFSAWSKSKRKLDSLSGVHDFCHHDFRRYFRSTLSALKVPSDIAEMLLNHSVGGTLRRTYDRFSYLDEKREAMNLYDAHLRNLLQIP